MTAQQDDKTDLVCVSIWKLAAKTRAWQPVQNEGVCLELNSKQNGFLSLADNRVHLRRILALGDSSKHP